MCHLLFRNIVLISMLALCMSCSTYQPVKNAWKTTKGMWNTYVSTPGSVDYEDRGNLSPQSLALATSVKGIDEQLQKLERAMQNADKPPTQTWLDNLFATFPWLNGFAGIKYDGTILGQQPADSLKELDFNPLLYEDKKQSSRALRADIQPSPLGPEIMLATPLYDGVDFLGIVVAYFDMRSLAHFSQDPSNMVILSPTALLWPGKFDYAATPLAGVDWAKVVLESTAGTCSNDHGTFFYMVRYLGNLPLIFALPEKGDFPEGNGEITQGAAFFPQERAKLPPPPIPERKPRKEHEITDFARRDDEEEPATEGETTQETVQEQPSAERSGRSPNEIQPGSNDSVLLRKGQGNRGRQLEERQLEGENVPVQKPRRQTRRQIVIEQPVEEAPAEPAPIRRPSPFGPDESQTPQEKEFVKPSPFGPATETREAPSSPAAESDGSKNAPASAEEPKISTPTNESTTSGEQSQTGQSRPARLPDGRPNPFGPE